ncbi:MAG: metal ABC transporter solute-binding protein, Zn/Mn family [Stellaceae bacterium]
MTRFFVLAAVAVLSSVTAPAHAAGPVPIVAAENFYGDVARQIGGSDVRVTSVLSNPDADPHLFEAGTSVARAVATAHFVVYNGIDYDPWMSKLLGATRGSSRKVVVVATLVGRKTGDNPHIWYDPNTMLALAKTLADDLGAADPDRRAAYQNRLARFRQSLKPVQDKIAMLRERLAGAPVTATEPVFGYMLDALGLKVRNRSFQLAVMNSTEPSASDIAAFEDDLKDHRVKLLIYNRQATDPMAARMAAFAKAAQIPVVGVAETEPPGMTYQQWMTSALDAVAQALPK